MRAMAFGLDLPRLSLPAWDHAREDVVQIMKIQEFSALSVSKYIEYECQRLCLNASGL